MNMDNAWVAPAGDGVSTINDPIAIVRGKGRVTDSGGLPGEVLSENESLCSVYVNVGSNRFHASRGAGVTRDLTAARACSHTYFHHLVQRLHEGDEDSAWKLVEQYGPLVRRAVRSVLTKRLRAQFDELDFVQEVWASFFRAPKRLGRFTEPHSLAAYIVTSARNKVAQEVRHALSRKHLPLNRDYSIEELSDQLGASTAPEPASREPQPLDVAVARERQAALLQSCPAHYRKIMVLKLQGHTCREIASNLQLAESTVHRILARLLEETAMSQELMRPVEKASTKEETPRFEIGDTVDVHCRIREGDKERIQLFSGVVIGRSGSGTREMFTVRRIVRGEGVEREFPLHSPRIAKIVVTRSGVVRRAKLYFLRDRVGKAVRLKERRG
jgi:large subunit ribosomal protein L19